MLGIARGLMGGPFAMLALSAAAAAPADRGEFDRSAAATKAALMVNPATALQLAARAETLAKLLPPGPSRGEAVATVQRLRGEAFVQMDRADEAEPLLAQALALTRRDAPGSKLEGEILMSSGGVHAGRGESAAAFSAYQAAHHIFQAIGDTRDQAVVLLCISSLYGDANDYAAALKYLDQAMAADRGDRNLLISIYNNRAASLQELGRYPEAEAGYRKALALARRMDSPLLRARILGNIARVRLKVGDVTGAETVIHEVPSLGDSDDAAAWRLQLTAIAAQIALQRRDYPRAAALIAKRFAGVDLATTTISSRQAHQTAYDTYRALGDAPDAVAHLAALKRLDDQATRLATSANSALAAARFDFANQELRLATLQRDDANRRVTYERQQAHTQRMIFLGLAAAAVFLLALLAVWLVTLGRSRNKERAAADDLALTNAALNKALAAKTEFLATTSHEIRTPLNGILGMTQVMLADPRLAGDTRERIGVVHGAGVTMRALVDDILDVAKMETGNLIIERAPFDLAATLIEATKMWAEQARGKGLAFAVDLDACPHWIEGDAARVRQITFNLLSNALKFTSRGHVALSVAADDDRFRIEVRDTGIGIAADKLDDIFESFRQADAGTTRRFGGTGLGLAICRNLARAMGGEIAVASVPGTGSTFTVTLPLIAAEQGAADAAEPPPSGCDGGVVVVDANPITRALLRTLVSTRCANVVAAGSLDEADTVMTASAIMLIDQSALLSGEALARLGSVAAASIMVLWRGEIPDAMPANVQVIAKPIGGPTLLDVMFSDPMRQTDDEALVQRAA